VDVPKLWDCFARVIAPLHSAAVPPLPLGFHTAFETTLGVHPGSLHGKHIAAVVHALDKKVAAQLWKESGLKFNQFVKDDEVQDFVTKNDLSFLASGADSGSNGSGDVSTDEGMIKEITKILRSMESRNHKKLIDFVETNLASRKSEPAFARNLTTAVAEFCIVMEDGAEVVLKSDRLLDLCPFLKRYLDNNVELQKQALYALQAVVHQHEHPNQMLYTFFDNLSDQDVVCDEAFYAWETCTDPAEQLGKGVCIKGVTRFFTLLREPEADDAEEDEENDD